MKNIIGKSKIKSTILPRKLTINKMDVYNKPEIVDAFNDLLQILVRNWPVKYQNHLKHLKHKYIYQANVIVDSKSLSINELKEPFSSEKNK